MRIGAPSVSLVVAAGLVVAGALTLPLDLRRSAPQQIWHPPSTMPALEPASAIPVFCMPAEAGAPPLRCGIARVRADGRLDFRPYGAPPARDHAIAALATADIGLLWALSDPHGQDQVRLSAAALVRRLIDKIHGMADSRTWQVEYRPAVLQMLTRIAGQAWNAPSTQRAVQDLVRAADPVIGQSVVHDIAPVVAPYLADAFWRVMQANAAQAFSLLAGAPLDLSSVGAAFGLAFHDPKLLAVLNQLGPQVLAMPETEMLLEQLVCNAADAIQRDPEIFDLLGRVVTDPRLGGPLGGVRSDAGTFLREAGQVLWGVGGSRSLNALAGLALSATVTGRTQKLVLLLDPIAGVALESALPGGVVLLTPEHAT